MIKVSNFINGAFVPPVLGNYIDSINPATGLNHALIPSSSKEDVNQAVKSASKAFLEWSNTSPTFRSKLMLKIAELIEENLEELAVIESKDQGKPLALAKTVDIPRCVYNFRFFATYILHTAQDCRKGDQTNTISYVQKIPVGVAGLISPWNLPLYLLSWKIAPAIAFGNTCVAKPSELTSVSAWKLCEIFNAAGLPSGVVNMVFGTGPLAGEAIVEHPDVPLISFTGSTEVGKRITKVASPFCKKLSLELGGKNAAIIFEDADLDDCVQTCIKSAFSNQGEICLCTSRLFVHENVYETFLSKFVEKVRALKIGNPNDPCVDLGALVSKQHYNKVSRYISLAAKTGGTINCGHDQISEPDFPQNCKDGFFMKPTVITNLPDSSPVMQEEIFGPVVCVTPFATETEVVKRANNVQYGLCACVWTTDLKKATRVSRNLEVGTVWTNCWLVRDLHMPFGGMKMSGLGRESGKDSQNFFTESKCICMRF